MRETDTLVSTVDEIRPDIGVPHHVRRNRVERGTSTTLSEPFTIRSRETYRFHGSDPLPFHQGSLVDALFTTHVCVCVFVSSIVLFVTYRFSYDRISRMGGRTSAYPVPRKSAPLSSMLFLFRPLSVKETRKPAFVRQTASGMCCFLHAAVYDRFAASNYFWMKIPLSSKLLVYSDSWMIRKVCFLESLVVIFVVDVL